jgi:hypothetical protein
MAENHMQEMANRINQLQQQVAQLQQVPAAQGADQQLRAFKQSLNHLPRFSGETGSFRDHLTCFRDWVNIEEVTDVRRQKMALVFSLKGTARNRIRHAGIGSTPFNNAATFDAYQEYLLGVFEPDSEKQVARMEFSGYKQQATEDMGQYLSTKLDLMSTAYPTGDGQPDPPFSMVYSAVVNGLFNKVVKRLVVRAQPTTVEDLRKACLEAVSSERFAYLNGFAESGSLDGLTAITRGNLRNPTVSSNDGSVPMEIDAMNYKGNNCRICSKPGHWARECPQKPKLPVGVKKDNARPVDSRLKYGGKPQQQQSNGKGGKTTLRCHYCDIPGHMKKECRKMKRDQGVNAVPDGIEDEDDEFFIDALEDSESFLVVGGQWQPLL